MLSVILLQFRFVSSFASTIVARRRNGGNRCSSAKNSGKPQKVCSKTESQPTSFAFTYHVSLRCIGYPYAALAHQCHGSLGDEVKEQMRMSADEACSHGSVQRSALVRSLKTELSIVQ